MDIYFSLGRLVLVLLLCFVLLYFLGLVTWHVGSLLLNQRSNPDPLQWKNGVLTTGSTGKSSVLIFLKDDFQDHAPLHFFLFT